MAVSALYTGSAPSARHDGAEPLGEVVNRRAPSAEIPGSPGSGDHRRSRRLRLGLLGGDDNGARRARAPLSRPPSRSATPPPIVWRGSSRSR